MSVDQQTHVGHEARDAAQSCVLTVHEVCIFVNHMQVPSSGPDHARAVNTQAHSHAPTSASLTKQASTA